MHDNKVSEKAIWEGSITPDNDTPTFASQMQNQPQMMFCYKCNNVIPGNSKFCPCCQTELYVTCPKCGVTYSSQYPICNQCGTNRDEYLQAQRREQERKDAIERENRRQREVAERNRLRAQREEQERREAAERYEKLQKEVEERNRLEMHRRSKIQLEAYNKVNDDIRNTKEYESTYSLFKVALMIYNEERIKFWKRIMYFSMTLPIIFIVIDGLYTDIANQDLEFFLTIVGVLVVLEVACGVLYTMTYYSYDPVEQKEFLMKYISNQKEYDKDMVGYILEQGYLKEKCLANLCFCAYRKKHGLPVTYLEQKI